MTLLRCVRNINTTHNYLYCEYVTGMVTYFDLQVDPHQLRNVLHTLTDLEVNYMHSQVVFIILFSFSYFFYFFSLFNFFWVGYLKFFIFSPCLLSSDICYFLLFNCYILLIYLESLFIFSSNLSFILIYTTSLLSYLLP